MRTVIDIGTNSTLLLVGYISQKQNVEAVVQRFNVTRLGEGVHQTGVISMPAMERTIKVLDEYRQEINSLGPMPVHVVGTQALRAAKNAPQFVEFVREKFGWNVQIITGEEEAIFSFQGAVDGIGKDHGLAVVMDLGGGSTEIIWGVGNKILGHRSLPLGVVRAAEKLNMRENLSHTHSEQIKNWAAEVFEKSLIEGQTSAFCLIGVGGTISTLAAVKEKMTEYDPEKVNDYVLSKKDLLQLYEFLNNMPLSERRAVPGMASGREDVILFGALIFISFMDYMNIDKVISSDRGLRFGVLKQEELREFS